MDIFDVLLHTGLITGALVSYLIFFRKAHTKKGEYRVPGWNYPLKFLWARYYGVKRWKARLPRGPTPDLPREDLTDGWDAVTLRSTSPEGVALLLEIRKLCGRKPLAEVTVHVQLADGTTFVLPRVPDTAIGAWEDIPDAWSAGGLKIQVLEPQSSLRIIFNGLLTNVENGAVLHSKFNLIWSTASDTVQHPEDWSDELAAEALALEPWRDGSWIDMLGKREEGGWHQWGAAQGRFEVYDAVGAVIRSEYVRTRGVRERRWAPGGHAPRRSLTISAAANDGTALLLRALCYKDELTQCVYGSIRLPDTNVKSVTYCNLSIPEFCETPEGIPNAFTFNVAAQDREFKFVVRVNEGNVRLRSGVPYEQETLCRTLTVNIDGVPGSGIIELGYTPKVASEPSCRLTPPRVLKWLSEAEVGTVGFCLPLDAKAAACPAYVGGKGASLALLASVQEAQGYRVPPGFCLTVHALEKHLETNDPLMNAVRAIEVANEFYNETNFKEKCNRAVELFETTELPKDVKEEILKHMHDLRKAAALENYSQDLRFAVRSSAVGEDSETLSAAGQNQTILGCISDDDVLKGVQKCWGSMFAFTSAYYRRQNGQPCKCGGGVVIQALAVARVAGVMFTRDPRAGDPSRMLITANYGLGESVVSGSVEPDTFVVKRHLDDRLEIAKIELGAKEKRVTVGGAFGVGEESVPEAERKVPCLSASDALRLAHLGAQQDTLWGAGRDIEWAIVNNEIFLLQARPITSLERWTEEELLHELDTPIMADDELTTFANCGEVFPKPVTPLSHDFVVRPLIKGMRRTVSSSTGNYEDAVVHSHNRCMIALYNSVYRSTPPKVDVNIRMIEMALHGHKVADDEIIRVAVHRRPPSWTYRIAAIAFVIKNIFWSKRCMEDTIKAVKEMKIDTETNDPSELLQSIYATNRTMGRVSYYHSSTSGASTSSQFIAMTVLLEGGEDFSPEQCNEVSALLNSGDVLSAEVPQGLARLAHQIDQSGEAEKFREQDPKNALDWLMTNQPEIYNSIHDFLEQHGHRAIMEFDMYTKPWVLVPEELMKILQNMRLTKQEAHAVKSDAEVIAALTTPKKSSTRKILAWVLPLCRRTVRHREGTKAHLILGVHTLRLAALRLARLLVARWYLPHEDLVFFFRANELACYIQTRDPALLRKAIQRQQYYPGWCKLKFAELNKGWVQPMEPKALPVTTGDVRLEATSVCGGEVIARACVVKDLNEIYQLQQGDVLITNATDIGWSPYFPLLSGIVTELGGLISHGAVIAREYGLPCIVGATHATDIFKTGDMVRLWGTKGVIEKVNVTKESLNDDS